MLANLGDVGFESIKEYEESHGGILKSVSSSFALAFKEKDGVLHARSIWKRSDFVIEMSSPVANGGFLYGVSSSDRGRIFCLDPATGKTLWEGPPRAGNYASVVTARDEILILTEGGVLHVVAATPKGYRLLSTQKVAETPTWAHLVPVKGGFLVKDSETLSRWGS